MNIPLDQPLEILPNNNPNSFPQELPETNVMADKKGFRNKKFLFNFVKLSALAICLGVVALCRISVDKSTMLLAKNVESAEPEVLGVFYKKPEVIPNRNPESSDPIVSASSVMVMDADSFTVLYEKNSDEQRPMASTTKMMTALVALREFSPTRIINIDSADVAVGGSSMYLLAGESFRLEDLIKGLLIPSGNDAALTLENEFKAFGKDIISEMNKYAVGLGLNNTHFVNTSGLHAEDHYSSAHDLAVMASYAMQNYTIRSAVSIAEDTVYSIDNTHGHYLKSTNELLGKVNGVDGIKTGYTVEAGQCFVVSAKREGHRIIVVILNSPNRFYEAEKLIEWAFGSYIWR